MKHRARRNPSDRPAAGDPPVTSLRVGTTLYHGTQEQGDFAELGDPGWVTDSWDTAWWFAARDSGSPDDARIVRYRVKAAPRLLAIGEEIASRAFHDAVARAVGPRRLRHDYADTSFRELARAVCEAGYDGWRVDYAYPQGGSDVLLCHPARWLELVGTEPIARPNPRRRRR
jgi:hypothetical protein